jgi:hypothetical protein
MTRHELLANLRKALRDIDRSRLTSVDKKCMLFNCLHDWRDAMRRHAPREFIASALRGHASFEETEAPK